MYQSVDFEKNLLLTVHTLTMWKVPLDRFSIRCLVKAYLDSGKIIHKRFKDNMPGVEWVRSFIQQNNLTKRIANNVRGARPEVSEEIISAYFENLEQSLNEIPAENIFNYYETNVMDNPGSKIAIVRHGQNRIERKTQHSKTCTSIMFCGSVVEQFLPPMVFYNSENLYKNSVKGGPKNAVLGVGSITELLKSGFLNCLFLQ